MLERCKDINIGTIEYEGEKVCFDEEKAGDDIKDDNRGDVGDVLVCTDEQTYCYLCITGLQSRDTFNA